MIDVLISAWLSLMPKISSTRPSYVSWVSKGVLKSTSRSIMMRLSIKELGIIPSWEAIEFEGSDVSASERRRRSSSINRFALDPFPIILGKRPYACCMDMRA